MTLKNLNNNPTNNTDAWENHVRYEIMDACTDTERLLAITDTLLELESLDLIPDQTADRLFEMIRNVNELSG